MDGSVNGHLLTARESVFKADEITETFWLISYTPEIRDNIREYKIIADSSDLSSTA